MAHNKFQLNQAAFQMIGALKLSGLAGAGHMSAAPPLPTGTHRRHSAVTLKAPAAVDQGNTIPRVLVAQAERYGSKPLIRFPRTGVELTYGGLVEQAEAASVRLRQRHGIAAGTVAGIYMGNSAEFVQAWFACLFAGVIDVPVNHEFRKATLAFALSRVDARVVFTDGDGAAHLLDAEVRDFLATVALVVLCGHVADETRDAWHSASTQLPTLTTLEELIAPGPPGRLWESTEAMSPALIRFTSGTTGAPKGILQSHLHVLGKSAVHDRLLELSSDDILYSPFPMHHNLASVNGLIGTLQAGATMVSVPRFSASRYWSDAAECGATRGHLLQSIAPLVSAQPASPTEYVAWRSPLWTGGPDPEFECRFNVTWIQTYALAEIGAISSKRHGSAGRQWRWRADFPEMEVQIVDQAHWIARCLQGCKARSPCVRDTGIASCSRISVICRPQCAHLGTSGFTRATAGFLAENGELHFIGRIGDTIRRRGVNISSDQIDAEVRKHPAVLNCARRCHWYRRRSRGSGDPRLRALEGATDGRA